MRGAILLPLLFHFAVADDVPCALNSKAGKIEVLADASAKITSCPDSGTDPDKISIANPRSWLRLDPIGLGSTYEVISWDGLTTNGGANYGIRAYMSSAINADDALYQQALIFYEKLKSADLRWTQKPDPQNLSPIESPATGKFDAWTEAKNAAGGDPYRALKIMAIFGHDNQINGLFDKFNIHKMRVGCMTRIDRLNGIRPKWNSLLYRNNSIAGRWYTQEDVEAGQNIAKSCKEAVNDACPALSEICNDKQSSYQADYYHVIFSAFAACRIKKFSLRAATYKSRLVVERAIAKRYKYERFQEEITGVGYGDTGRPSATIEGLRRALDHAYLDEKCALPRDLKFEGPCANIALAVAQRQAFEMCFRVRQHQLGFDFGYNAAGCR